MKHLNFREKSLCALILPLALVMLFTTACAEHSEIETSEIPFQEEQAEDIGILPEITKEFEETKSPQHDKGAEEDSENRMYVQLTQARNFSDGYAWVWFDYPIEGFKSSVGIMKTSGEIISSLTMRMLNTMGADFSDGYSYINLEQDDLRIFGFYQGSAEGERCPDDGTSYTILAGGDGVYFVRQEIRSMTENEDRYGFITPECEWIMEPTADNPLTFGYKDAEACGGDMYFYYLGEHIFLAYIDDYMDKYAYYNVDTGESAAFEESDARRNHFLDSNDKPYQYKDGYVISWDYLETGKGNLYIRNRAGDVVLEKSLNDGYDVKVVRYGDGIIFLGENGNRSGHDVLKGKFYNTQGKMIIDLSEYDFVTTHAPGFYEFNNGVAAVKILGADEEYYITHIDLNGNFLYEPVKVHHASGCAGNGNGAGEAIYICDGTDQKGKILKTDGSMAVIAQGIYVTGEKAQKRIIFCDGYAWFEQEQCFVGLDGKPLEVYDGEPLVYFAE